MAVLAMGEGLTRTYGDKHAGDARALSIAAALLRCANDAGIRMLKHDAVLNWTVGSKGGLD